MVTARSVLRSNTLTRSGFSHGFTTRLGGVSPAPFDTFDFAVLRDQEALFENQRRLASAVGFAGREVLHQAIQVHGAAVVVAEGDPRSSLEREADALVAHSGSGYAVAVRVADCVPVLVGDRVTGGVAAIHAGWRGIEAGVIRAAFERMQSAPTSCVAAIGPCIGSCCFEVGVDVAERIAKVSADEVIARSPLRAPGAATGERAFVDLRLAARVQLRSLGFSDDAIDDVPSTDAEGCTRCNGELFYSYRRDGDASGRLIAVIVSRGARSGL